MRKMIWRILAVLSLAGLVFLPLGGGMNRLGLFFALFTVIPAALLFGATFIPNRGMRTFVCSLLSFLGAAGVTFLLFAGWLDGGAGYLFDVSGLRLVHGMWITWLIFWILLFFSLGGEKKSAKEEEKERARQSEKEPAAPVQYCAQCGAPLKSTAAFCNKCGTPVKKNAKAGSREKKAEKVKKGSGNFGRKIRRVFQIIALVLLLLSFACIVAAFIKGRMDAGSSSNKGDGSGISSGLYEFSEEDISVDEEQGILYINDIVMVFFEPQTDEETKQAVVDALGGEIAGEQEIIDLLLIRVEASSYEELETLCADVEKMDSVVAAEVDLAVPMEENYEPNDPFGKHWYNSLWTDNEWDVDAPSGNNWWAEAIDAPAAWEHRSDMETVSVGVVDSGFDDNHEDLSIELLNPSVNSPSDHGTHVSGLIGATMDNEKGIAGVAPNARLLGWDWEPTWIQKWDGGWDTSSSILSGVILAIEEGGERTVVNLSLGLDPKGLKDSTGSEELTEEMVDAHGGLASLYVTSMLVRGYDFVIVQSAGNGDTSGVGIEAVNNGWFSCVTEDNCETLDNMVSKEDVLNRIIIVASANAPDSDGEYTLSKSSNYGDAATIAAPGNDIYSLKDGGYTKMSGTSMAAPITAGAAAAVWGAQPGLSGAQIKDILVNSSETEVQPNSKTDADDDDTLPLLNVGAAVEDALQADVSQSESSVYEKYMRAAQITASTGSWTEEAEIRAEMDAPAGADADTYYINGRTNTEITDFDQYHAENVNLDSEGYSRNDNSETEWEMEYADGTATYHYTEPAEQNTSQNIPPQIFNFFKLKKGMVMDGADNGEELSFRLSRESLESLTGTTLQQLMQTEAYTFEDVTLTAHIDPSSGALSSQTIEFTGGMAWQGDELSTEFVLEYHFTMAERDEEDQTPGNGDMSEERDIVLVLDNSGSMMESAVDEGAGTPIEETKIAAEQFINTVFSEEVSVGIVTYNGSAHMDSDFSKNSDYLKAVAYTMTANGGTDIEAGLSTAEEMLSHSSAREKIIVLMSDGMPNDGKQGDELIAYANTLKGQDIDIYTLGFFTSLEEEERAEAQSLMTGIASEGRHYEVDNASNLRFFFDDIADQINGQQYIYIRIACPVDVTVTAHGETLTSVESELNTRTSFGTLTFEESDKEESDSDTGGDSGDTGDSGAGLGFLSGETSGGSQDSTDSQGEDDRVKILRLKEGSKYDIQIEGNGNGRMDYTIGFMDDEGEYTDFRTFENIKITRKTKIDTVAENASSTVLNVDEDGDGRYDLKYRAKANGEGELVSYTWIFYTAGGVLIAIVVLVSVIVIRKRIKRKKKK